MADAYPTTPPADGEIPHEYKPTMEIISFGDGYTQRHISGINSQVATWTLSYTNLTATEKLVITDFIDDLKGDSCEYQLIEEASPRLFIIPDGYRETRYNGEFFDLQVTLVEVHDLI